MRIGILTLHDSPNYGAVLQAFALRAQLARMGHEAVVIDRRRDPSGVALRTPPAQRETIRLGGLFSVDAANGAREYARRCARTLDFLKTRVGLTDYSFHAWTAAPREMGFDAIVVGSDQVWNANNLDPNDYLLRDVPGAPRGIAYAASLGMTAFPSERVADYRAGFARFAALGVREREAVELVRSLGFDATHVVDPVLLAGADVWRETLAAEAVPTGKVFAYFLAEDVESLVQPLASFGASNGRRVDLFVDWFVRKTPRGLGKWLKARRYWRDWSAHGIDFRLDAGPLEFVRSIAAADVVVSNSYHALMFAILFGKEVRIVLPTHPVRRKMNARLKEFEGTVVAGRLVYDTLAEALAAPMGAQGFSVRESELAARVAASREWLRTALEGGR